jgi:hypothetical protein
MIVKNNQLKSNKIKNRSFICNSLKKNENNKFQELQKKIKKTNILFSFNNNE